MDLIAQTEGIRISHLFSPTNTVIVYILLAPCHFVDTLLHYYEVSLILVSVAVLTSHSWYTPLDNERTQSGHNTNVKTHPSYTGWVLVSAIR